MMNPFEWSTWMNSTVPHTGGADVQGTILMSVFLTVVTISVLKINLIAVYMTVKTLSNIILMIRSYGFLTFQPPHGSPGGLSPYSLAKAPNL